MACLIALLIMVTVAGNVVAIGLQIWYKLSLQLKRFETQRKYFLKLKNGRVEEGQNQSCIEIED